MGKFFSFQSIIIHVLEVYSFFFLDQKASTFLSAHPYVSKEDWLQARRARLRRVPAQQQQDLLIQQVKYLCSIDFWKLVLNICEQTTSSTYTCPLNHTNTWLNQVAVSLTVLPSLLNIQPPIPSINTIPHQCMLLPNPIPLSKNPVPSSSPNSKMRTIILGDGKCIKFMADDVGPALAISFVNDLPQLNRMWDDTSEFWDGHLVLIIKGVPIPIVYWKEVYVWLKTGGSSWKPGHWKRVRGSWCEWEVSTHQIWMKYNIFTIIVTSLLWSDGVRVLSKIFGGSSLMLLARSSHIHQLLTISHKFGRNRIEIWQIVQEYIMVRNSRIYFSTKKVVCSLSKPRIAISQSSSDRSWQSRACLLEIMLLVLTRTWTLIDSEWRCLDFLPVSFNFFFFTML